MKKRGAALVTVLIIVSALLIIGTAVSVAVINTTKLNARYSDNIDLELAAKSGVNIIREDFLRKVTTIDELNNYFSTGDMLRGNIDEVYDVQSSIQVEYTISKLDNSVELYSKAIDRKNNSIFKDDKQVININSNGGDEDELIDLLGKGSVFVSLGNGVENSIDIKITDSSVGINPGEKRSNVRVDSFYVQPYNMDLNDKSIINIKANSHNDKYINTAQKESLIKAYSIKTNEADQFIINSESKKYTGMINSLINGDSPDVQGAIDQNGEKVRVIGSDGKAVGIRKRLMCGITVILIHGDIELNSGQNVGSIEINNAIIYASGNINITADNVNIRGKSMLIAGKKLNLQAKHSINVDAKQMYSEGEKSEIDLFIKDRRY